MVNLNKFSRKIPGKEKSTRLSINSRTQLKSEFIPILGAEKVVVKELGFKKNPKRGVLHFNDGSILYSFGSSQIHVSQRGKELLKANPGIIKDYLSGKLKKGFLASGGNANVFVIPVKGSPSDKPLLAVKEFSSGLSPFVQKNHLDELRKAIKKRRGVFVPEVFLAALVEGKIKGFMVMQFMHASKVVEAIETLENKINKEKQGTPRQKSFQKQLDLLKKNYFEFEKRMKKNPKIARNLTDFHEGNILTSFNPETKKYEFVIVDQ
ncbi:MAG: hypothetical protein JW703_02815 [Candidatus Diapherotrites archaeon]|nr:hypothetical protein [Candidatus Diapherotrites archaeon]